MSTPPKSTAPGSSGQIVSVGLLVAYVVAIVAVAAFVRPLSNAWLVVITLLPAMVLVAFGIPKVARARPRRIAVVFHLIVYPLFAAVAFGLPGAYVAFRLGRLLHH